jgi:hypothetical protein
MKKLNSKYLFSTEYINDFQQRKKAEVVLEIDYISRTYDIKPFVGDKEIFIFKRSSHNWKMWKAVLRSIDEAIDFANNELGLA